MYEPSIAHSEDKERQRVPDTIVVETGPVEYEKVSAGNVAGLRREEEDEIYNEDELEEEEPVSAAQLMGIDNEGKRIIC